MFERQMIEGQMFNAVELSYLESKLLSERNNLLKGAQNIDSEIRRLDSISEKINRLKSRSAEIRESMETGDLKRILEIILLNGPLPVRNIIKQYLSLTGQEIEKVEVIKCLKENRGKSFRVVGERVYAKWELIDKT